MTKLRAMGWMLAIVVLPFVELWTLLELGASIGVWGVLGWCALVAVLGVALMRRGQARMALRLQRGELHADGALGLLEDGFLVVAGGLLAFPGLVSDVLALLLLVPVVRAGVVRLLRRGRTNPQRPAAASGSPRSEPPRPAQPTVAPGDVVIYPPGTLRAPFKRRPVVIDVE